MAAAVFTIKDAIYDLERQYIVEFGRTKDYVQTLYPPKIFADYKINTSILYNIVIVSNFNQVYKYFTKESIKKLKIFICVIFFGDLTYYSLKKQNLDSNFQYFNDKNILFQKKNIYTLYFENYWLNKTDVNNIINIFNSVENNFKKKQKSLKIFNEKSHFIL